MSDTVLTVEDQGCGIWAWVAKAYWRLGWGRCYVPPGGHHGQRRGGWEGVVPWEAGFVGNGSGGALSLVHAPLLCSCAPPTMCQSASAALAPPSAGLRNVSVVTYEEFIQMVSMVLVKRENDTNDGISWHNNPRWKFVKANYLVDCLRFQKGFLRGNPVRMLSVKFVMVMLLMCWL